MSNNKYKILIADADKTALKGLSALLENTGYKVITAGTAAESVLMLKSYMPDIVISEISLPDKHGAALIEEIKKTSGAPIIILSENGDENVKVTALDAGANDYITKPCGTAELLARIRVSVRICRSRLFDENNEFSCRNIKIDYGARRVFANGKEIKLTQNEYNILAFLAQNSGKAMTYREIIKAVWGDYSDHGSIKRLQVNIANIRKKSDINGLIVNIPGIGYRAEKR